MKLYENKNQCCGCGACAFICPQNAINLAEDQYGFIYPVIEEALCVKCGLCENICAFGKTVGCVPENVFAASNKNLEQKKRSASAGIFVAIAEKFIVDKGLVVGAEMFFENDRVITKHTVIRTIDDLQKLQGSKYVQSTVDCYKEMEQELTKGKKILFSGTPCQVAEIKKYFSRFEKQLFTIDLICHGVPNQSFFNDYIKQLEVMYHGKISKISFRDKEYGWGLTASVEVRDENGEIKKYYFGPESSSYYSLFLDGDIYRDSCYTCSYAKLERVGDLTIGDYWGVEDYSPEILKENGGDFDIFEGVSCVLSNTEKGNKLLSLSENNIQKVPLDIEKILVKNTQLRKPAEHTKNYNTVLKKYSRHGYNAVEKFFQNRLKTRKIKNNIKGVIPYKIKQKIKKWLIGIQN